MPLYVQVKNPFDYENPAHIEALREYAEANKHGPKSLGRRIDFIPKGNWEDIEASNVQNALKELGHDSFYVKEDDMKNLGIYDSKKVKSAIGNRGTYDITDPDITKADGGKIVKGIMGALSKASEIAKAKKLPIEAPSIIIPSKISNVKEAVRQGKGDFGARRVERAADEIPNLEKMYQENALKEAFIGDNARAVMTMNPKDFEKYASPIPLSMNKPQEYRGYGSQFLDDSMKDMTLSEYIDNLSGVKGGFADVPYLLINKEEQGLPLIPFISGHEGRHRSRSLANQGEQSSLVQFLPRAELREPLPRRTQEEYIEALKKELEMTDNKVVPQRYQDSDAKSSGNIFAPNRDIIRPAVDLPDIYAEGGGVKHMAKAGRVGDVVEGGLSLINKAKEIAKARKAENAVLEIAPEIEDAIKAADRAAAGRKAAT
jgi:hypothetical protein